MSETTIPTAKVRKVTDGAIRNKQRTKQKMINAVGIVLQQKGYVGLTIKNICTVAGVDRKLVSTYFGDINTLIETYLRQKDFWTVSFASPMQEIILKGEYSDKDKVVNTLHTLFDTMYASEDLRRIMQWEISEPNKILRELSDSREASGSELFKKVDAYLGDTNMDVRAMLALQTAGIYYLSIHSNVNGSTFCEIDLNTKEGQDRIKVALTKIIEMFWDKAVAERTNA